MASKCNTVTISYVNVVTLGELDRAGDCFYLGGFGGCGEVLYRGWWCATTGGVAVLSFCNYIEVVTEFLTAKYLVEFLWDEFAVTPAFCCIRGVFRAYV